LGTKNKNNAGNINQDVDTLGQAMKSVKVKNGYARNYLIPAKLAIEAILLIKSNWKSV
jgi:large subunit ribosomal protein L9